MRQLSYGLVGLVTLCALATGGCRDSSGAESPDAPSGQIDAPVNPGGDGIAEARAAGDGDGLALTIHGATVTYLKRQVGSASADPAGFTIQAAKPGPALFIAVDPATLAPPAVVGDVVDFTITGKHTVAGQPRATALAAYARTASGHDVGALAQDLTGAADVVNALDSYESELVNVTASVAGDFSAGGTGFLRASIKTTALDDVNFQIRAPAEVIDAVDLVRTCTVTVTHVPMGRFNAQAQLAVFQTADLAPHNCPPPQIVGAAATSATSLRLTFSRHIAAATVRADGSQFALDHGLTVTAAVVTGKTITLTTSAQDSATSYGTTIASTVTDLLGESVANPTTSFAGFGPGSGALISKHTTLGLPSPSSAGDPNSFLSVKPQYVLSYNGSRKVPNWVSWELNTTYLGQTDRQNDFRPDDTFPGTEPQASLGDYSGSGYDRGHMCPSADRTLDAPTNSQTFYLTHMVPQAANNNQGPWVMLEDESRTLARAGKELFIVSGGTFSATSNIVGNGLMVPDYTYKVIVVLDAVGQGAADVTTSTRVIAVLMPNENALISKTANWRSFRVSVDTIEAMTGYNFLSDVDPTVQDVIEARVDNQ